MDSQIGVGGGSERGKECVEKEENGLELTCILLKLLHIIYIFFRCSYEDYNIQISYQLSLYCIVYY